MSPVHAWALMLDLGLRELALLERSGVKLRQQDARSAYLIGTCKARRCYLPFERAQTQATWELSGTTAQ